MSDYYESGNPINRCTVCACDIGECNPRQLCCKTYCPQEELNEGEIFAYGTNEKINDTHYKLVGCDITMNDNTKMNDNGKRPPEYKMVRTVSKKQNNENNEKK